MGSTGESGGVQQPGATVRGSDLTSRGRPRLESSALTPLVTTWRAGCALQGPSIGAGAPLGGWYGAEEAWVAVGCAEVREDQGVQGTCPLCSVLSGAHTTLVPGWELRALALHHVPPGPHPSQALGPWACDHKCQRAAPAQPAGASSRPPALLVEGLCMVTFMFSVSLLLKWTASTCLFTAVKSKHRC